MSVVMATMSFAVHVNVLDVGIATGAKVCEDVGNVKLGCAEASPDKQKVTRRPSCISLETRPLTNPAAENCACCILSLCHVWSVPIMGFCQGEAAVSTKPTMRHRRFDSSL